MPTASVTKSADRNLTLRARLYHDDDAVQDDFLRSYLFFNATIGPIDWNQDVALVFTNREFAQLTTDSNGYCIARHPYHMLSSEYSFSSLVLTSSSPIPFFYNETYFLLRLSFFSHLLPSFLLLQHLRFPSGSSFSSTFIHWGRLVLVVGVLRLLSGHDNAHDKTRINFPSMC
jgi:hypothetical protein